jgi:hypothetical protein
MHDGEEGEMYRYKYHFTVRDSEGWNEVMDVGRQSNVIAERLGLPTATFWTETVGGYNHLVAEVEYETLAALESSMKAMNEDPEAHELFGRLVPVTVAEKGYTELWERAE